MNVRNGFKKASGKTRSVVGSVIALAALGTVAMLIILVSYVLVVAVININRSISKANQATPEPVPVFISSLSKGSLNNSLPGLRDSSLFPDKKRVAFSDEMNSTYSIRLSMPTTQKRFRIFMLDLEAKELALTNPEDSDKRVVLAIGSQDHVAPLVSPTGKHIAFAVTRDDCPTAIYLMDSNGANIRKITPYYSSIAFGWMSENELGFWASSNSDVDLKDPKMYKYGKTFTINVQTGEMRPLTKTPQHSIPVKHITYSEVKNIN